MNNTIFNSKADSNTTVNFQSIPHEFKSLFERSPELIEKVKGISLGLMVIELIGLVNITLTLEGKKLFLEDKTTSEKNMDIVIKRKVESYNQIVKNIALPAMEASCNLLVFGGVSKVLTGTVSALVRGGSEHLDSKHRSELTGWDHSYNTEGQFVDQNRRCLQDANQMFDKLLDILNREMDRLQEGVRNASTASAA